MLRRDRRGRPLQAVCAAAQHIARRQRAIDGADAATRAFLLADFHVCLADAWATACCATCCAT
jgi:hypothetical protein